MYELRWQYELDVYGYILIHFDTQTTNMATDDLNHTVYKIEVQASSSTFHVSSFNSGKVKIPRLPGYLALHFLKPTDS